MTVIIPIHTVSEANQREHWSKRHRRNKAQQRDVWRALTFSPPSVFPLVVTLTRIAPRRLDTDNLAGSNKGVQDAVARWLGIDDGSAMVAWVYAQRKGAAKEYAVEVAMELAKCTETSCGAGEGRRNVSEEGDGPAIPDGNIEMNATCAECGERWGVHCGVKCPSGSTVFALAPQSPPPKSKRDDIRNAINGGGR